MSSVKNLQPNRFLRASIQLSRPMNVLITMFAVWVGAVISGGLQPLWAVICACLSAGSIAAAANTINDYFDVEIDRINKPNRALPAGYLSFREAFVLAILEYLLGIGIALFVSFPLALMAAAIAVLTYLYSAYLKGTPLWGNVAVSLSTAAAFVFGGLAVQRAGETFIPASFTFFFHFGREIIKDMEDMEGDRQHSAMTFPIRFGTTASVTLIWINFLLFIPLTVFPYWMGWYGQTYFFILAIGVYPVVAYVLISILRNTLPAHLKFLSNLLKADMVIGLIAVYLR